MGSRTAATLRRRFAAITLALCAAVVLPGVASAACPDRPAAREFARWLDPLNYTLVPGGHFENGTSGWVLSGGARVVPGNDPFYLHAAGESKSLYLPAGSSAQTPFVCVELLDPVARFVARNRGSILGALAVDAVVRASGGTVTLPAGVAALSSAWQPSLPMLTAANLLSGLNLNDGTAYVAFRFRPVGLLAAWQIDDVYVDPFRSR